MNDQPYSRREVLKLLGIITVGLASTGCSGRGGEPQFTVEIIEPHFFTPADLTIPVGARVAWKNRGTRVHTVTADPRLAQNAMNVRLPENVQPFDSGNIFAGQIYSHTFVAPGEYIYFCRYHEHAGMIGTIRVIR